VYHSRSQWDGSPRASNLTLSPDFSSACPKVAVQCPEYPRELRDGRDTSLKLFVSFSVSTVERLQMANRSRGRDAKLPVFGLMTAGLPVETGRTQVSCSAALPHRSFCDSLRMAFSVSICRDRYGGMGHVSRTNCPQGGPNGSVFLSPASGRSADREGCSPPFMRIRIRKETKRTTRAGDDEGKLVIRRRRSPEHRARLFCKIRSTASHR